VIEGGEYNLGPQVDTTLGAIYDPVANSWTSIAPPTGWGSIGDASSVVLPNGTFMLGACCSSSEAELNASTLTWTTTGQNKADSNSEEGWTLLPNGKVLTVDATLSLNSELFTPGSSPSKGTWASAGNTPVQLASNGGMGIVPELGPAILRPNGTVFATGATSNTAIYDTASGTWSTGPVFPSVNGQPLAVADGPAALLPNGNVLVGASPFFKTPTLFYEFDGSSLASVSNPARASGDTSFDGRMLVLPSGQILSTDGSQDAEIYSSIGAFNPAWRPSITSVSSSLSVGQAYTITGTQFNGLSQGAAYGDDAQSATNYPLVRIINNATGHVFYARTFNHSTMAVATGSQAVSTFFTVPSGIEHGASTIQVVANGIPSAPVNVTVP
jgi:hypothetical protein